MPRNSLVSTNRLRIIGGQWRSRVLSFPDRPDIRPTPDRVRETLFNWLQGPVMDAHCLDLFAGSGALGLEALSRGAASVTALEQDAVAASAIRQHVALLQTERLTLLQRDVLGWLNSTPPPRRYDLVFLDPPFAAGLYTACCAELATGGWLAPGALVYLEADQDLARLELPPTWSLTRHKRAGAVHFGLCRTD